MSVGLNRRQAGWAEDLKMFNFELFYRKGTANTTADILSTCPAFTSREDGNVAVFKNKTMLDKEQWLEIGTMELDSDNYDTIDIGAMKVELLLP
jgi:hypothetical protein